MNFPSCGIFECEGQTEKEDLQSLMMKERESYTVRACLPWTDPAALGKALASFPLHFPGLKKIFQFLAITSV